MITLTPRAASTIRELVHESDIPDSGGLRISNDPSGAALTLSLAAVPAEDDKVLDDSGARLFLDSAAAALLDHKTLDAEADLDGRLRFGLAEQGD